MIRVVAACAIALLLLASSQSGVGAEPLISINVQDAELSDVIALLAAEGHVNVVVDASVGKQKITLRLQRVPFEAALDVVLSAHGLEAYRDRGVLVVGSSSAMNLRNAESAPNRAARTQLFALRHARAGELSKELEGALPPGTVIVADERTSSLVVTGDEATLLRTRLLVRSLDVANRRPLGSANVTHRFLLRFVKPDEVVKELKRIEPAGIYIADPHQNAILVSGGDRIARAAGSLIQSVDVASPQVLFEVKVADVTPRNDQSNFGLEFGGETLDGQPSPGGTTYAFRGGSIPINVTLNALITEGRAQILATPRLVTLNNKEADLLIGQTYPIVFNTSVLGGQNVQFVDIGVKLRLTPTIGPDGMVTAELHPEYSELLGFTGSGYPIIANRKIDSTLRVANDQTIVLGGLMRDVSSQTIARVPGLSSIPILGAFFKNKQARHERDEIVFLITPHVIFPDGPVPQR